MSKEFMKIGPITCSIQADPPYKEVRNSKTDFTIAKEKPQLISDLKFSQIDSSTANYDVTTADFTFRINDIGAEILKMCNGKNTIQKIAYELSEQYDFYDDEFLEQVKTFLNIFRTYKLL